MINKKIKFNFIQSNIYKNYIHKFVFLFSIEKWNKGSNPEEIRLNILFWEFNFSIYNKNNLNNKN